MGFPWFADSDECATPSSEGTVVSGAVQMAIVEATINQKGVKKNHRVIALFTSD